jgi:aspartate 1-decarboxylase
VQPGDLVIVFSYADYTEDELAAYVPRVVHVDEKNQILDAV